MSLHMIRVVLENIGSGLFKINDRECQKSEYTFTLAWPGSDYINISEYHGVLLFGLLHYTEVRLADGTLFASAQEILDWADSNAFGGAAGGGIVTVPTEGDLPLPGKPGILYIAVDTGDQFYWDPVTGEYVPILDPQGFIENQQTIPQDASLWVSGSAALGPYNEPVDGRLNISGATGELSLVGRDAVAFVSAPLAGERWALNATGGKLNVWSGSVKVQVMANGNTIIGAGADNGGKLQVQGGALSLAVSAADFVVVDGGLMYRGDLGKLRAAIAGAWKNVLMEGDAVPTGGAILNQNTVLQVATFRINGDGTLGNLIATGTATFGDYIRLANLAADPALLAGALFYRSDTQKLRAAIAGVWKNLATEDQIPAPINAILNQTAAWQPAGFAISGQSRMKSPTGDGGTISFAVDRYDDIPLFTIKDMGSANLLGTLNIGAAAKAVYSLEVSGNNPNAIPTIGTGFAFGWNRQNGSGNSNLVWCSQGGALASNLSFDQYDANLGTVVTKATLSPAGVLDVTGGLSVSGVPVGPLLTGNSILVDTAHPSATDVRAGKNNYSQAAPFKTINAAVNVAVAGDTVHVRKGTYAESIYRPVQNAITLLLEPDCIINGNVRNAGDLLIVGGGKVDVASNRIAGTAQIYTNTDAADAEAAYPNLPLGGIHSDKGVLTLVNIITRNSGTGLGVQSGVSTYTDNCRLIAIGCPVTVGVYAGLIQTANSWLYSRDDSALLTSQAGNTYCTNTTLISLAADAGRYTIQTGYYNSPALLDGCKIYSQNSTGFVGSRLYASNFVVRNCLFNTFLPAFSFTGSGTDPDGLYEISGNVMNVRDPAQTVAFVLQTRVTPKTYAPVVINNSYNKAGFTVQSPDSAPLVNVESNNVGNLLFPSVYPFIYDAALPLVAVNEPAYVFLAVTLLLLTVLLSQGIALSLEQAIDLDILLGGTGADVPFAAPALDEGPAPARAEPDKKHYLPVLKKWLADNGYKKVDLSKLP